MKNRLRAVLHPPGMWPRFGRTILGLSLLALVPSACATNIEAPALDTSRPWCVISAQAGQSIRIFAESQGSWGYREHTGLFGPTGRVDTAFADGTRIMRNERHPIDAGQLEDGLFVSTRPFVRPVDLRAAQMRIKMGMIIPATATLEMKGSCSEVERALAVALLVEALEQEYRAQSSHHHT